MVIFSMATVQEVIRTFDLEYVQSDSVRRLLQFAYREGLLPRILQSAGIPLDELAREQRSLRAERRRSLDRLRLRIQSFRHFPS